MKRTWKLMTVAMAVLLMMCMVLTGCGGGGGGGGTDPIVGKWSVTGMDLGTGTVINLQEFAEEYGVDAASVSITFDIKADGTLSGDANGETASGTLKKGSGNEYTLTMDGSDQICTLEDGKLIMESEGIKMILTK